MRPAILCLILPWLMGCYSYVPVDVYVVDWETRGPILGADAAISYAWPLTFPPFPSPPKYSGGTTDAAGYTRLRVADTERESAMIGVLQKDYYPTSGFITPTQELIETVVSSDQKISIRVSLIPQNMGRVRLVIPKGYRGPVKIRVIVDPTTKPPRDLSLDISPEGDVYIRVPRLFANLSFHYKAFWPDGTAIPGPEGTRAEWLDDKVALRFVELTEKGKLYVLGTRADTDEIEDRLYIKTDDKGMREFDQSAFDRLFEK
jgi:hypothetical protein